MKFELKPTTEVYVEVYPEESWLSIETPESMYNKLSHLDSDINRHIDCKSTYKHQTYKYAIDNEEYDNVEFDTLYEAISEVILNDIFKWTIRGKGRKNDEYNTRRTVTSFQEVVNFCYSYPYEFEVLDGELSEKEKDAISKVLEFRFQ